MDIMILHQWKKDDKLRGLHGYKLTVFASNHIRVNQKYLDWCIDDLN